MQDTVYSTVYYHLCYSMYYNRIVCLHSLLIVHYCYTRCTCHLSLVIGTGTRPGMMKYRALQTNCLVLETADEAGGRSL